MAVTQNTYTGDGSTVLFSFTFPYLETTDIKVSVNGTDTTAYTLPTATSVQFTTAPANGAAIRIYRKTDDSALTATFYPGSAIRSSDLNDNFTQNLYVTQESNRDAAQAIATAGTALTTANTAATNATTAISTANTASTNASSAVTTANTASTNASSAVSTANTASSNASTALTTANSAVTTANAASASATTATSTANTASTNAATAVSTANSALTAANSAVSTANTASTNASSAVSTANAASTTAASAVTTANSATSTANAASSVAAAADTKADAAIAAVASSVNYTPVANVAGIPASPTNNTYIEIADSTGLESFTPLAGKPAGFVGDSGLSVRLRYTTSGTTWNWLNYYANDSDARFLKKTGGTMTGKITLDGNPSSNLHAATKQYVDSADSTLTTATATAQATADAALPKAGGTMTGNITFNAGQTFPTAGISTATTGAAGIVQLTDSTSSTSTTTAATPNSVKSSYDLANSALPKSGGTMTGNITFNAGQSFPTSGISAASTSAAGIVQLSDSTSSTSSTTAATSAAVKSTYDFASVVSTTASAALPKAGGLMTGSLGSVLGTSSSPGIYFTGDTNTGFYSPGADTVAASTAGSERLRIDSSGRVGIGTTSPGTTLDVNGGCQITGSASGYSGGEVRLGATTADLQHSISTQSTGTPFMFFDHRGTSNTGIFAWRVGTGGASERMRIDSSGRLLVGTSTATNNARLNSKLALVNAADGTYGNFSITNYGGAAADRAFVIDINRSRGTTDGSMTSVSSGDILGYLVFRGADGTNFTEAALIKAEVDGTPGTNDMPGRLVFATTSDGASAPAERMRIDSSGVVSCIAGIKSVGVYNYTTSGGAANVHIDANYDFRRSTSCLRFKADIETLGDTYADAILNCRPVWYRSLCGGDNPEWGFYGFIAEEVEQIDKRLCTYGPSDDGSEDLVLTGVQYDRFVPHLLNLIKRQQQAIETLEAKVAALEGA